MYNQVSLYRYFDVEDTLLYVGVSDDPLRRAKEHRSKFWYDKAYRATTEWYPSKVLAHEAERRAIIFENPVFNKKRPRLPANFLAIDPHAVYVADILTDLPNHSDPQTGEICITPEQLAGFDAVDVSQKLVEAQEASKTSVLQSEVELQNALVVKRQSNSCSLTGGINRCWKSLAKLWLMRRSVVWGRRHQTRSVW